VAHANVATGHETLLLRLATAQLLDYYHSVTAKDDNVVRLTGQHFIANLGQTTESLPCVLQARCVERNQIACHCHIAQLNPVYTTSERLL